MEPVQELGAREPELAACVRGCTESPCRGTHGGVIAVLAPPFYPLCPQHQSRPLTSGREEPTLPSKSMSRSLACSGGRRG